MFKKSIKKEVMKVIASKINELQERHDVEVTELDFKKKEAQKQVVKEAQEKLDSIYNTYKMSKEGLLSKYVNEVLGKFI
jgi:hypothetical protein